MYSLINTRVQWINSSSNFKNQVLWCNIIIVVTKHWSGYFINIVHFERVAVTCFQGIEGWQTMITERELLMIMWQNRYVYTILYLCAVTGNQWPVSFEANALEWNWDIPYKNNDKILLVRLSPLYHGCQVYLTKSNIIQPTLRGYTSMSMYPFPHAPGLWLDGKILWPHLGHMKLYCFD